MRKILLTKQSDEKTVLFCDVNQYDPIFVKCNNRLAGMVVKEDRGWIIRLGGDNTGSAGFHKSLLGCLQSAVDHKYEYYIED